MSETYCGSGLSGFTVVKDVSEETKRKVRETMNNPEYVKRLKEIGLIPEEHVFKGFYEIKKGKVKLVK